MALCNFCVSPASLPAVRRNERILKSLANTNFLYEKIPTCLVQMTPAASCRKRRQAGLLREKFVTVRNRVVIAYSMYPILNSGTHSQFTSGHFSNDKTHHLTHSVTRPYVARTTRVIILLCLGGGATTIDGASQWRCSGYYKFSVPFPCPLVVRLAAGALKR